MNGIVPVVIMVGRGAVPTAIFSFECGVIPLATGILSAYHSPLTGVARCPNLGRVDFFDVPLDA